MTRFKPLLIALAACLPLSAAAQTCETLATIGTDGTGAPDRYRVGGSYFSVPIEKITPDSTLNIVAEVGPIRYVTLHTRFEGGYWRIGYRGDRISFNGDDTVFNSCREAGNCTHINVLVNGIDEKYETLVSSARVELCKANATFLLDTTWTAPRSGWQIDLPHDWERQVEDDPNGGTGMFISPDQQVIVGVSTVMPDVEGGLDATMEAMRQHMFDGQTPDLNRPVSLGGLEGRLQRFILPRGDTTYRALVAFLVKGPKVHAVWGLLPVELENSRGEEITSIMNTFRPFGDSDAGQPYVVTSMMRLVMLAVRESADVGYGVTMGQEHFSADVAAIHLAAAFNAGEGAGVVTQSVTHLETGRIVTQGAMPLSPEAGGELRTHVTLARPAGGWMPGTYLVAITLDGVPSATRLFSVEDVR